MSYRLSGINPLAYVGVEPSTPPQMLVLPRAPLPTDSVGYNLGTYWLVAAPPPTRNWELWILVDLTAGVATWVQLYPGGSGGANQFDEDVGIAIPALGIINVLGGANMNTFGSGNTILINLNETIHWPSTTADGLIGAIYLGGSNGSGGYLFMHNYGVNNTWLGENAGNLTLTYGTANNNTGIGEVVLNSLTTGAFNTSIGAESLTSLTSGDSNFAGGAGALQFLLTGNNNVCIGVDAGSDYTGAETNNIIIANDGVLGESDTIRIGVEGLQTAAYMAGIYDEPIGMPNGVVYVDSTGKLGTGSPVPPPPIPGGVIVTIFDSSGTWTKNANTKLVKVIVMNGGSGGGSGAQGVTFAGFNGSGGGGGGGSGLVVITDTIPAFFWGATETVTIGAGGAGGASQAGINTAGIAGTAGGVSAIGNITLPSQTTETTFGGGGVINNINFRNGPQTTNTAYSFYYVIPLGFGISGQSSVGSGTLNAGLNGFDIGGTFNNNPAGGIVAPSWWTGSSGGGGGGADSAVPRAGGNGGNLLEFLFTPSLPSIIEAGGAGGISGGTIDGANGNSGFPTDGLICGGLGGGGGGGQSTAGGAVAGNGGNGGIPGGGGGGGGGSINGTSSGAGGNGAHGRVIVIEYLG